MINKSLKHIPIDYLKAELIDINPKKLELNPLLEFRVWCNTRTGELSEHKVAKYQNLEFTIFNSQTIWIKGSLHVFFNGGKHNYNDYSLSDFNFTVNKLYELFDIKPTNIRIMTLEWGFNIVTPFDVNKLLDSLILHKTIFKTTNIDNRKEGQYLQFKHKNYTIKIYNKGQHYKLSINLLRIEIKQNNFSEYRKMGVYTLQDFIKSNKFIFLEKLIDHWENIVIYDIDINSKFNYYALKQYWKKINDNRHKRKYHSDKLKKLNMIKGNNSTAVISKLILEKCNELQV